MVRDKGIGPFNKHFKKENVFAGLISNGYLELGCQSNRHQS
jgi:hypothetical protein